MRGTSALAVVMIRPGTRRDGGRGRRAEQLVVSPDGDYGDPPGGEPHLLDDVAPRRWGHGEQPGQRRATRFCMRTKPYQRRNDSLTEPGLGVSQVDQPVNGHGVVAGADDGPAVVA